MGLKPVSAAILLLATSTSTSNAAAAPDCAWILPRDPIHTRAECAPSAFPPRTKDNPFVITDKLHRIPLVEAMKARATVPKEVFRRDFEVTRETRAWGDAQRRLPSGTNALFPARPPRKNLQVEKT